MSGGERTGVLIVGAGPTGLTLGCLLHRWGVPCRIVDEGSGPTPYSRALGMFTRSLEIFDELDLAEGAIGRGHPIELTNIHSGDRRIASMRTVSLTGTRRAAILSLPQYETEALLEDRFETLGGVVERETRVTGVEQAPGGRSATVTMQTPTGEETVEAGWVIGADGAHSVVRKALGIPFPGRATRDVFVIFDALVDSAPPRHQVQYHFAPQGVTVVLPLPDGAFRFAISMRDFLGDGSPVAEDTLQRLLERRVGGGIRLRGLRDAGWGADQVRVHMRVAETFRRGRCLLAGDAAHVHGPLGGQGMNGGIQDAHNLAWKLALVCGGGGKEALLDSYAAERRAISRAAARIVSGQAWLGTVRPRAVAVLRDRLFAAASATGLLERQMLPRSVMLAHVYPRGPAIATGRRKGVGARLPDVVLGEAEGRSSRLFDRLRERPFTVLVSGGSASELAELQAEIRRRWGERVGVLTVAGDAGLPTAAGRGGATLCLARADGFLAALYPLRQEDRLFAFLDGLLERGSFPAQGRRRGEVARVGEAGDHD